MSVSFGNPSIKLTRMQWSWQPFQIMYAAFDRSNLLYLFVPFSFFLPYTLLFFYSCAFAYILLKWWSILSISHLNENVIIVPCFIYLEMERQQLELSCSLSLLLYTHSFKLGFYLKLSLNCDILLIHLMYLYVHLFFLLFVDSSLCTIKL